MSRSESPAVAGGPAVSQRTPGANRHCAGLSLLELLIAISVAAISSAIAIPSFSRLIAHHRLVSTSNEILSAATSARLSAISRNVPVTFCAGRPDAGCHRDWSLGEWMIFEDQDSDGEFDLEDQALLSQGASSGDLTISANGPFRTAVIFRPSGLARTTSGAFAAGRVRVCVSRLDSDNARDLVLIGSGRIEPERKTFPGDCPSL